jgi:hypothetical protein
VSDFRSHTILDFKVSSFNGEPSLSLIVFPKFRDEHYKKGAGVILNNSYRIVAEVHPSGDNERRVMDMHEFNVLEGGSALLTATEAILWHNKDDTSDLGFTKPPITIGDPTFQEIDIATGMAIFEWNALDHILPSASFVDPPTRISINGWDWMWVSILFTTIDGWLMIFLKSLKFY